MNGKGTYFDRQLRDNQYVPMCYNDLYLIYEILPVESSSNTIEKSIEEIFCEYYTSGIPIDNNPVFAIPPKEGAINRLPYTHPNWAICHWLAQDFAIDDGKNPGEYRASDFWVRDLMAAYIRSGATPLLCPPKNSSGYVFMQRNQNSPAEHMEYWRRGSGNTFLQYTHTGISRPGNRVNPIIREQNINNGIPEVWDWYDTYNYFTFFILTY